MAVKKSLYQLLEVSPAASEEVIRAAYAARITRLTESADPDAQATRAMLRDGLEILCDPARRKQYDERLREELRRAMASGMDEPRPRPASARASAPSAPGEIVAGLSATHKLVAAAALLVAVSGGTWVWLDHARKVEAQRVEAERIARETRLREDEARRREELDRQRQERADYSRQRSEESHAMAEDRRRTYEIERARREKLSEMQREEQTQTLAERRKAAELQRVESQRLQQERQDVYRQQQQLERERRQLRELEQNRGMKF